MYEGILKKRNILLAASALLIISFIYVRYNIFISTRDKILSDFDEHQLFIARDICSDINAYFTEKSGIDNSFIKRLNLNIHSAAKRSLLNIADDIVESTAFYDNTGILIKVNGVSGFKEKLSVPNLNRSIVPDYFVQGDEEHVKINDANNYFDLIIPLGYKNKINNGERYKPFWIDYRINAAKFFQLQLKSNHLLNSSYSVWVVDEKGFVIYQENHPQMTGRNIKDINSNCLGCHDDNSYLGGILKSERGSFQYSIKEKYGKSASYTTIDLADKQWKIIVSASNSEIFKYITSAGTKATILVFLFTAFMFSITLYVIKLNKDRIKSREELKHLSEKNALLKQIAESEKRYEEIFENNPVPMWVYDSANLRFLIVNRAAVRHYGYTENEFLSMTLKEIRPEEEMPKFEEIISNSHEDITEYNSVIHQKKDGSKIDVNIISHPLPEKDGLKSRLILAYDVTDQNKLQKELIESEERYKQLVEKSPDAIGIVQEGKIVFLNIAGLSIIRSENEAEIIGEKSSRFFTHDGLEQYNNNFEKYFGERNPVVYETKIRTIYGEEVNIEAISLKILHKGKPAIQFIARDITERKIIQKDLEASEEKYRKLFTQMMSAFSLNEIILNESGEPGDYKTLEVNDTFEAILGAKREDIIGKRAGEILPPEELKQWLKIFGPVAIEGKSANYKMYSAVNKKYFEGKAYSTEKGRFAVIFDDVTERILGEELLKESEERYRTLFNISPDSIFVHRDNKVLYANPSGLKLIGAKSFEELTRFKVMDVVHPDYREKVINRMKMVANDEGSIPLLHEKFIKLDGSIIDAEVSGAPVIIQGKIAHLIIARDITDRIKAEDELQKYRAGLEKLVEERTKELDAANVKLKEDIRKEKEFEMMLKQSLEKERDLNELKTRFISTASHEFRTPLTAILSSTELIQRYGYKWNSEKINEHIKKIKISINNLTKLLDDVLTMSRSESGRILFSPQIINLPDLCSEIIHEVEVHTNNKHILKYDFKPDQKEYNLDQRLLRFILINLLSNAIKYSPDGGEVSLIINTDRENLIFKIKDNGIGIPKTDMKHLFEPFYRCKNVGEIEGTGLGLSIVQKSVELHTGNIICESLNGNGTMFTVTIPYSN